MRLFGREGCIKLQSQNWCGHNSTLKRPIFTNFLTCIPNRWPLLKQQKIMTWAVKKKKISSLKK